MKQERQIPAFQLPVPLTPLLGREREVTVIRQLLQHTSVRLVTLTGPGGVGKTRLGLEIVRELGTEFADGIAFVSLASIRDPDLVISTITQAFGLPEASSRGPFARLQVYLRNRQLLLFLDNFEQVVAAAPHLAELLVTCPDVRMLVASRAVLHISGEHEYPVSPLALPDLKRLPNLETLIQTPAVALFIQRVLAVRPDFKLTQQNVAAAAEICVRLDGLPLSIVLAATRVKMLPPQAILARLTSILGARLQLLTGGPQDLPMRQQTLRDTIAWSYSLLNTDDQNLFRQLSVFVGGFTLEAVEAVASNVPVVHGQVVNHSPLSVLDKLTRLLDQSLMILIPEPTDSQILAPRYTMLETIQEYGLEQLGLSSELDAIQQAHAAYYLQMAEEAEPKLTTSEQGIWKARLDAEHDNLRTALRWSIAHRNAQLALRLSGALWWFWYRRGYWTEGRQWLVQALSLPMPDMIEGELTSDPDLLAHLAARAKALNGASILAHYQGDYSLAATLSSESVALFRQLDDQRGIANALHGLALVARSGGNYEAARAIYHESLTLFRALGDSWHTAYTIFYLGVVFWLEGDYNGAEPFFAECLPLFNQLEDQQEIAYAYYGLGHVAFGHGDYQKARTIFEQSLSLGIDLGDQRGTTRYLYSLGDVAVELGDDAVALTYYREGLTLAYELGDRYLICWCLDGVARVAIDYGQLEGAIQLFGAAAALRDAIGTHQQPFRQAAYEWGLSTVRTQLDATTFATAWTAGQAMTLEQAVRYALTEPITPKSVASPVHDLSTKSSVPAPSKAVNYPDSLTSRELEVLHLIATGMTDAQVAVVLVVSTRTVNAHLRSIYSKLGVTSRSAATRYAIDHRLV